RRSSTALRIGVESAGKKIFHMPGQRDYERTSIATARGERMFCSSSEALEAGWQPAKR
ncbi:thermonuclease family protein, partial [Xanthomonas hortorum pv. taraxaci]|nr:thermonuclease family protein [Xanthomonas hortorum pv. taraxaci]